MTEQEKRSIASLNETVGNLCRQNNEYRELLNKKVDDMKEQVEEKQTDGLQF